MKPEFRDYCVDDIESDMWRQLSLFEDPDYADEMIQNYSLVEFERSGNRKKQACQIGFSLRQAREYFQAASAVSMATRPILLYYGAVSLSRCCCLLRLGGAVSDDSLRKAGFKRHHGLEYVGPADEGSFTETARGFFEQLCCRVRGSHNDEKMEAKGYGNFSAFTRALVPVPFRLEVAEKRWPVSHSEYVSNVAVVGSDRKVWNPPSNSVLRSSDLLRHLPDMYGILTQAGLGSALFPGRFSLRKTEAQWGEGSKLQLDYMLSVDHLDHSAREALTDSYVAPNGPFQVDEEWTNSIVLHKSFVFTDTVPPDEGLDPIPRICDDARTQKFFCFSEADLVEEPAAYLALLFCLGWLSRYNADLWVRALKKKSIIHIVEAFLSVANRKFPNLILDQMTNKLNHFHG